MHASLAAPARPASASAPSSVTVADLVDNVETLLSLPDAAIRLNALLVDPDVSNKEIAEVVGLDPGLAARVLRAVNSAWFGLRGRVDTIAKAISMIGTAELHSLVLATSAAQAFRNISHKLIDMETFWQHSVRAALAARHFAESALGRRKESVFLAGLLHDVGQLVILHELPGEATRVLEAVRAGAPRGDVERALLGFTHAEVGAVLLERWNLPASLTAPVRWHHDFEAANEHATEAALVHLGSLVSHFMETDESTGDAPGIAAPPEVWAQAKCSPDDLAEAIGDVSMHWLRVVEIVAPGSVLV